MTRQELLIEFIAYKAQKEATENVLKSIKKQIEEIEKSLILSMESENLQSFKDKDIGTVFLREDVHASVENFDLCYAWLNEHNMQDIVRQTIHPKIISAVVKDNGEIPGVKAFYQTKVGIRKGGS